MSKAMTYKELGQLLKHIHDRRTSKLLPIKYERCMSYLTTGDISTASGAED